MEEGHPIWYQRDFWSESFGSRNSGKQACMVFWAPALRSGTPPPYCPPPPPFQFEPRRSPHSADLSDPVPPTQWPRNPVMLQIPQPRLIRPTHTPQPSPRPPDSPSARELLTPSRPLRPWRPFKSPQKSQIPIPLSSQALVEPSGLKPVRPPGPDH